MAIRILNRKGRVVIPKAMRRGLGDPEFVNILPAGERCEVRPVQTFGLQVDPQTGRVTVPKSLREALGLTPYCDVRFEVRDQTVWLSNPHTGERATR